MTPVSDALFARPTLEVARALIGVRLSVGGVGGVITETEAYADDAASHYITRRHSAAIMGATHGRLYVYRIYGMHHCLNVTTDAEGPGAVLLRALEPTDGLEQMRERRGRDAVRDLCSGPAKLFVALGLDPAVNGEAATDVLSLSLPSAAPNVAAGPRIGISKAVDLPWRFTLRGSRYLSR